MSTNVSPATTNVSSATIKGTLLRVLDDLAVNRLSEVLDFALFVKARQAQQRDAASGQSVQERHALESQYPLHGAIVHYDDPFAPVAQSDWEALQ